MLISIFFFLFSYCKDQQSFITLVYPNIIKCVNKVIKIAWLLYQAKPIKIFASQKLKNSHFCMIHLLLLNKNSLSAMFCPHGFNIYFISLEQGQRICRRGTERPCYKVSYIQDSRRRLTFEDARQACRLDGGELLSIETEGEQRLVERFIAQIQAGDGDYWIGLRRNPQRHNPGTMSPGCPSQYYWLDGSKAKFRFLSSSESLSSVLCFGCRSLKMCSRSLIISVIN